MNLASDQGVARRDLVWLYLATGVVLVAGLLVYRLASQMLGESGFAEYALVRRAVSFLNPALMLGLGVGLPRFLAMRAEGTAFERPQDTYWLTMFPLIVVHVLLFVAAASYPDQCARLIFGSEELSNLTVPIMLLVVGLSWHSVLKSFCRGTFRFGRASGLDVLNLAVVPILAFVFFGSSVESVVLATAQAIVIICVVLTMRVGLPSKLSFAFARQGLGRLLTYSLPRVPGDFALAALLAAPSLIAANIAGTETAGFVAFGSTMLALGGAAVAPISTAMLPLASHRIHNGQWHLLRKEMAQVMVVTAVIGVVGVAAAEILMPVIIDLYLGSAYAAAVPTLRVLALGALPYVVFCSLRSFLDAAHVAALNTRNALLALVGFALGLAFYGYVGRLDTHAVLVSANVGQYVLGILTALEVWKLILDSERNEADEPNKEPMGGTQ